MNTADEKGSAVTVGVPGKFLPQPGSPLTAADLMQLTGVFHKFYDDAGTVGETPATPTATFSLKPTLRPRRR